MKKILKEIEIKKPRKMTKKRLVFGVGVNDYDGQVISNRVYIKSYSCWIQMLSRCYNKNHFKKEEYRKNYENVFVCDEWLYFSNFKKWFDENYRWDLDEIGMRLELDKDLLSIDIDDKNTIYSPKNCVFIPNYINNFIKTKLVSSNKTGHTGIVMKKLSKSIKLEAFITIDRKTRRLGTFNEKSDAIKAYNNAKLEVCERYLKELYDINYEQKVIDKFKFFMEVFK